MATVTQEKGECPCSCRMVGQCHVSLGTCPCYHRVTGQWVWGTPLMAPRGGMSLILWGGGMVDVGPVPDGRCYRGHVPALAGGRHGGVGCQWGRVPAPMRLCPWDLSLQTPL